MCLFATIPAFADSGWLLAETDKDQYHTGDRLEVSGYVLDEGMPEIGIRIYDPDGQILGAYSVELEPDNSFSKTISLDSPFYDQSGLYVIEFVYGQESDELFFEVIGAAPEPIPPASMPTLPPEVLMVSTDKDKYTDNEFITISGLVSDVGDPTILIGIFDPDGSPAGFYMPQINSDLEFTVSFLAKDGVNFKKEGIYSVRATYGQSKQVASFSFVAPSNQNNSDSNSNDSPPPQITTNPQPKPIEKPQDPKTTVSKPSPQPVQINQNILEIPSSSIPTQELPEPDASQQSSESNNISEEEIEIGKVLNKITLECDGSHYTDSIIYGQGMGAALMRLCNYEQAESYFDTALAKDPDNPEILTNKGAALAKQGKFGAAIEHYNLALKKDPKFVSALNNKANVLADTGKLEDAIVLYNKILDMDQTNDIAKLNLQKAKEEMVRLAKAQVKEESVSVSLDNSVPKIETTNVNYDKKSFEAPKPVNVLERIGSIFAGFFGFLK